MWNSLFRAVRNKKQNEILKTPLISLKLYNKIIHFVRSNHHYARNAVNRASLVLTLTLI